MNKIYLNNNLGKISFEKIGINKNLQNEINKTFFSGQITSRSLRETLLNIFCNHGYIKGFKIHDDHNLRITGIKDNTGLSIFLGHYAGVYYEMTKLAYLKKEGIIDNANFILPSKKLHKEFLKNANMATYERISKQMSLFNNQFDIDINFLCIDINKQE